MSVLLTIEKVIMLRAVTMFAETSEDVLAEVASILGEQEFKAGQRIIEKGEPGTTMYIIAEGRVRVHTGDTTVATLGERDAFGELSALDPELRSASVTAVDDTRLLCLDHEQLFELMSERIEVGRGIIRFLCRRYRGSVELAQKWGRDSEGRSLVPPPPFQTLMGPLELEGIPTRSRSSPIQIERGASPKQARS